VAGRGEGGESQPRPLQASDPALDVVYPLTYFAGATEEYGAMPLMVKTGDAIEANVQMTAVPSVHLLLTNMDVYKRRGQGLNVMAAQRPFGGVSVPVVALTTMDYGRGVYEVGGLPPGELRLTVNRGGDGERDAHGVRVNAADGETVDLAAKTATSTVSGTVVMTDGSKVETQGEVVLRSGD